ITSRPILSSSAVVTPGRMASRMRACISATTLPAFRILAISSLFLRIWVPTHLGSYAFGFLRMSTSSCVDGPDEPPGDLVGLTEAVDGDELVLGQVPGDQWFSLLLVQRQPAADGGLGVVLPVHHLTTTHVATPPLLGGALDGVVGPAGVAHPTPGQPA